MHPRARELVDSLQLARHPEGGWYREAWRSPLQVRRELDGAARSALTSIFFLLNAGEVSRWHRVAGADEAWHHYEGAPLELLSFAPDGMQPTRTRLGADAGSQLHVVPADWWQAARSLGEFTLVGCTVGPGFEFGDFAMLRDLPPSQRPPRPAHADFALFV